MNKSKVYFTKKITPESLIRIYEALNIQLNGKVGIKISTGEPGGNNYLKPNLIGNIVSALNGTIIENCTAYHGKRDSVTEHMKTIKDHGFLDIAPCDILDQYGEMELSIKTSGKLKGINIVGKNIEKYDSILVLSHFKGHAMAGFGGALKNISIGLASRNGKAWIHSAGRTKNPDEMWNLIDDQEGFLKAMAEASESICAYLKNKLAYINVANNISIDCDCDSNPHEPEIKDIGIFASLDPVALDKCCYDQIMNLNDENKKSLVNRMIEKKSLLLIEHANELNVGNIEYDLVSID